MRITTKVHRSEFSIIEIGQLSELSRYSFTIPNTTFELEGKLFIGELLGLTSSEISFNVMQPSVAMPFIHKHRENEEVYIIIKGLGQILLNDIVFEINEGSVIRVSPETERTIRNNSTSDLIFIVIQGKLNSIKSQQIDDGYSIEKQQKWQ
jgi:mannose-6-phosphate isomerase-like protein (cupin superfamily)